MSRSGKFDFGGREIPKIENVVVQPSESEAITFHPQVLAFLIARAIPIHETNLALELLKSQDTGTEYKHRMWESCICGNCGLTLALPSATPVIAWCPSCIPQSLANQFRLMQAFMHQGTKLTDEFAACLSYAIRRLPFAGTSMRVISDTAPETVTEIS